MVGSEIAPTWAVGFDSVSYLMSAGLLVSLPRRVATVGQARDTGDSARQRLIEGLNVIRTQPVVRSLSLLTFGVSWTGGAITALLVVFAARGLHIHVQGWSYGLLSAAGALGAVGGAALAPRWATRTPATRVALWSLLANTVSVPILALAPFYAAAAVAFCLFEGTYTLITVTGITVRQRLTPAALQARVNTTARMIAWGGQPVGAVTGGILALRLPVREALLVAATPLVISTASAWLGRLRNEPGA